MSRSTLSRPLKLPPSKEDLNTINAHLKTLSPQQILQWSIEHIPSLYQTTAFGMTGLVAIDMLSKMMMASSRPPLVFLDTLYHFPETYELVDAVKARYNIPVIVYQPEGCTTIQEFDSKYGERLWERNEGLYDYAVKVEPARRAYAELGVKAVITGRRSSQGGARASLQPLEMDETGLLKVNPFFAWTFEQVESYIKLNNVPHNRLLEQGYRSVGDWHSTMKSGEGDGGERAGRWPGREEKTECGLHEDYFKMKQRERSERY